MQEDMNLKQNVKKVNRGTLAFLIVLVFTVSFFIGQKIIVPGFSIFNGAQVVGTNPVITNPLMTNVTQNHATIFWDTDIPASTQILLGPTVQTLVPLPVIDATGVASHRYEINTLTPCTRSWFRVKSVSLSGVQTTSAAWALDTHGCQAATSGDALAPNAVSDLHVTAVTPTSVTLAWSPVNANGGTITKYYIYGGSSTIGNRGQLGNIAGSQLANPTFTVTGLTPGVYSGEYGLRTGFRIMAVDSADNYSEMNVPLSVTIPDPVSSLPTTNTTAAPNTWSTTTLSVAFTCVTGSGASCTGTYYKFVSAGTTCPAAGAGYTAGTTASTSTEGAYTLCYYSTSAGGTEAIKTLTPVGVDKTSPTGQITAPAQQTVLSGTAVTFTTSAADTLSGVAAVTYKLNGVEIGVATTSPFSLVFDPQTKADGSYTLVANIRDAAGKASGTSGINVVIDKSCDFTLLTDGSNFSSQLNSTGNPIGGGKCYTNIISQSNANYVVSTKTALKSALTSATAGQIIYVSDSAVIDLTGEHDLTINPGVTLASGRGRLTATGPALGALLYSNSYYASDTPLFRTAAMSSGGGGSRITGLRIRGPQENIVDQDYSQRGTANAFRSYHNNVEIDNNEFYGWDKWALYLYINDGSNIHHNYFHDIVGIGFSYAIWQGGSGTSGNGFTTIKGNLFGPAREHFDKDSTSSFDIENNIVIDGAIGGSIGAHGDDRCNGLRGWAGYSQTVENNLFMIARTIFVFHTPQTGGFLHIRHNWFQNSLSSDPTDAPGTVGYCDETTGISSDDSPKVAMTKDSRVNVTSNFLNATGRSLPIASFTASAMTITAGQSITFDGSASFDPEGSKIINYRFQFADGEGGHSLSNNGYEQNAVWNKKSVTYTFSKPGVYDVNLMVQNSYGIVSEKTYKWITVNPIVGTHVVSLWVKDTYTGTVTGRYQKQLVVADYDGVSNEQVVWSDDVAGDEGWTHVVVDLDAAGIATTAGTYKSIIYRIAAVGPSVPYPTEIWTWVDNFNVFGTATGYGIQNPGFEVGSTGASWLLHPGSSQTYDRNIQYRGGDWAFRARFGDTTAPVGQHGDVYQRVKF